MESDYISNIQIFFEEGRSGAAQRPVNPALHLVLCGVNSNIATCRRAAALHFLDRRTGEQFLLDRGTGEQENKAPILRLNPRIHIYIVHEL